MAIPKKLLNRLDEQKIKYKIISHRKVYTAYDATQTQHLKPAEAAKAVLLKGRKNLCLAVLPASHNCDFKALSKLAGDKLSIAGAKNITGKLKTKVGLLTPFGSLYKLPVYMDKKLVKNKKLNLPGSYTESLEISVKDYLKSEQPALGNFSKKK